MSAQNNPVRYPNVASTGETATPKQRIYHMIEEVTGGRPRARCGHQFTPTIIVVPAGGDVTTAKRPGVECPACLFMTRLDRELERGDA